MPHPPSTIPKPVHIPYFERNTDSGDIARWVAFIVLLLSTVAFYILGYLTPKRNRAFHYISATVALISTFSYFALATGTGSTFIYQGVKLVQGREVAAYRQVPYARYIDATLTTPLILFELGLLAGLSWIDLGAIIVANESWIVTQLFAALSHRGPAMWVWYTFSCISLVHIIVILFWNGVQTSRLQADHVPKFYFGISLVTAAVWLWYTIAFALSNGTNTVNLDGEIIMYAILDIIAKSAVGFLLVFAHYTHNDNHAGTIPEYITEPRAFRRIQLTGNND